MSRKSRRFGNESTTGNSSSEKTISLFDSQLLIEESMSEESLPEKRGGLSPFSNLKEDWKKQLLYPILGFAVLSLFVIGVMGKNGWLPSTDALTGKKTGWFGSTLPANASSSWNPMAAALPTPTPQLSKEYIYAGSRMLAVEDAGANAATATGFSMTATTVNNSIAVKLDWGAAGTGIDHYEIERASKNSDPFQPLPAWVGGTALTYTDNSTTANQAYLYRVKAVQVNNSGSSYSNLDAATAIAFEDDPIEQNITGIKAVHISQLQQAVNAMRTLAGLSQIPWTNNAGQGQAITAAPLTEMRTALNDAITKLEITTPQYTDANYSGLIYKRHIEELRQHVK